VDLPVNVLWNDHRELVVDVDASAPEPRRELWRLGKQVVLDGPARPRAYRRNKDGAALRQ
jgi:hypothetical protein